MSRKALQEYLRTPDWFLERFFKNKIELYESGCFYKTHKKTYVNDLAYLGGKVGRLATWVIINIPEPYQKRFYERILSGTLKKSNPHKLNCIYNF